MKTSFLLSLLLPAVSFAQSQEVKIEQFKGEERVSEAWADVEGAEHVVPLEGGSIRLSLGPSLDHNGKGVFLRSATYVASQRVEREELGAGGGPDDVIVIQLKEGLTYRAIKHVPSEKAR